MMVTVLVIVSGAIHGMMAHSDDPGMFGSLLRASGSLQVLLQPLVVLREKLETIPEKEVTLSVQANDMSWTYIPTALVGTMTINYQV